MTENDLQRLSDGAEELRQTSCDRAVYLIENNHGGKRYDNEIEAMLEVGHDPHQWDTHTPDCVAADAATQTAGMSPTGRENLTYLNIKAGGRDTGSPEVSNTGLLKYRTAECESFPSTSPLRSGGYDGGTSNSFFGQCDSRWADTLKVLERGKMGAQHQKRGLKEIISLGGEDVIIHPRGKSVGNNHYQYCLEWGGYDLKIWGNLESKPSLGDVRVRYGAEPILEYGIDECQRRLLGWLSGLGFTPHSKFGERLSNVDVNVCVPISVGDFESLTRNGQCVTDVKKEGIWKSCGKVQTYSIGCRDRILLKIYDKKAELTSTCENVRKRELTILRYIGDEWFNSSRPVTRVEISIGRDALKGWGINSLAEFRARERDIVDLLTFNWFRILAKPKVRGHENTADLHPYWKTVRAEFLRCFDCSTAPLERVKKNVSVDMKRLRQQIAGCVLKVIAYKYGKVKTLSELRMLAAGIVRELLTHDDFEKLNNIVDVFEAQKNCKLGNVEVLDEFKRFAAG